MLRPQGVHKAYTRCAQGAVESGEKPGRAHKASTSRPQGVHKKTQQLHFRKDQNWICAHKVSTRRPQGVHKTAPPKFQNYACVHKPSTRRPQGATPMRAQAVHKAYTRRPQGVHKPYTILPQLLPILATNLASFCCFCLSCRRLVDAL